MSRAMRRVRTVVFPVPAPATTSMGPRTCSVASRWRSSGTMVAAREADFEDAIDRSIAEEGVHVPVRIRAFSGQLGKRDGGGCEGSGFRSEDCVAQRGSGPVSLRKQGQVLLRPAAFG